MKADPPVRIRAADARNNFAEILGRAHFAGETFLIEKQGKPYAVIVGINEYRRLLEAGSRNQAPDISDRAQGAGHEAPEAAETWESPRPRGEGQGEGRGAQAHEEDRLIAES